MKLIKFFKYDNYLLEGLVNHTLYFSNVIEFNDPFEGIFRYSMSSDSEKFKDFYLNHYQGTPDKFQYYFNNKEDLEKKFNYILDDKFKSDGVCCFSTYSRIKNVLMWSLYADKHKGICLVFDVKKIKLESVEWNINMDNQPKKLHKVKYTSKYLNSDPLNKELTPITFLTTKFKKWQYEREYRYLSNIIGNHFYNPESLIEIVFGLRMSKDSKDKVKKIVSNSEFKNIRFKRIELEKNKFNLKIIDE